METIQLIAFLRRWSRILIIGLLVGLIAGYFASRMQKPTYLARTKILVSRELQGENSSFAGMNAQQLTQTYVQILKTKHLKEATSDRIGFGINDDHISVDQVPDTQIIEITVEDSDPERAAQFANTMVLILKEENEATQAGQFSESESNLTKQIDQVKEQLSSLQSEYDQAYQQNYQDQLSKVNEQIDSIQAEISKLQIEIGEITNYKTAEGQALLADKELRIEQLQASYKTYDDLRANLIVIGKPIQSAQFSDDPNLQQMKTTINMYQQMYLDFLSSLETTRLARLKQTPNVVQIEEAYVPEKPVRPMILLYTLVSGMIGLGLAATGVFLVEILRQNVTQPEKPSVTV